MFEIKNVSKQYGDEFALRNVSLSIGKGLNFIIGPSGSGKTTLLKIMSGMEKSFEGDVFYLGQNIKALKEQEKSYFYNQVFGFVWQDFNLLEDLTVTENIMLPGYLKGKPDKKAVKKVLHELKISEFANQKVKHLSGGQKQRVAIARELMKNPQVIIADEPTSALDEKSSKVTMDILKDIAKSRTVIVVTHDTSFIDSKSKIFELDKGELVSSSTDIVTKSDKLLTDGKHSLTFKNACTIAINNSKAKLGRFSITSISLLVASILLLVTLSGAIIDSSQSAFDKLFSTYGEGILDVSVVGSFMSAGGTDGSEKNEPNANVSQDIGGLYDEFLTDERVDHIVFSQAFNNIKVKVDGKEYDIETSNSVPTVNKLTAGVMPMGDGNEVVVPNSFVKKLGLKDKDVLGKTIDFSGTVYNWDSGEPVEMPVTSTVTIVGVVDTTVKYDYDGQVMEYSVEDSFFFSKSTLEEMRTQADINNSTSNFTIRAKTPADMISIKDDLNAGGIVPLGRFELVEDMVRLNKQTTQQSGSAMLVIGILSVIVAITTAMITSLLRKREYAIYKVSGYSNIHLMLVSIAEFLIASTCSIVLFLLTSPIINMATTALWNVNILNVKLLTTGTLLVVAMGALSCTIVSIISTGTKAVTSLKTGDR
jgi:ABC-type lipoprotein export system ATPase subunit